jgi:leucyl/phenylalanyl-tRNA--protein transferase
VERPLLWFSPDPRMVLRPHEVVVSRSLRKTLRRGVFEVRLDTDFEHVVRRCAEIPRRGEAGTWITDDMAVAYQRLFDLGYAHSMETWAGDELVGGLYGVALGRMFFGESMFSRRSDASKVALVLLARQLARWGFEIIDCQMSTDHLASLGAREIARASFLRHVRELVRQPPVQAPWRLDRALMDGEL